MNEYDEECLQVFLEKQLQLFQEEVATTPEEAEEFLSDCMALICKDLKDVKDYFDEEGVDISGLSLDNLGIRRSICTSEWKILNCRRIKERKFLNVKL